MIIDLILDRKDGMEYDPREFYNGVCGYMEGNTEGIAADIARAMDGGTESDVKRELKKYIDWGEYNPEIKGYIDSVTWLTDEPREWMYILDDSDGGVYRIEVTGEEFDTEDMLKRKGFDPGMCSYMFSGRDITNIEEIQL